MKLSNFFKRFFRRKTEPMPQGMPSDGRAARLLQMLDQTLVEEYSCEEVYELLDQYAEMVARGEDVARLMPLVAQHLEMCPDCREEYEALLRMMHDKN